MAQSQNLQNRIQIWKGLTADRAVFISGYVQLSTPITQSCGNSVFYGEMIGAWWDFPQFLVDRDLYCKRPYDICHPRLYQQQCHASLQYGGVIPYTCHSKTGSWEEGTLSLLRITHSDFWLLFFTDLTQVWGLENTELLCSGSKSPLIIVPWISPNAILVLFPALLVWGHIWQFLGFLPGAPPPRDTQPPATLFTVTFKVFELLLYLV